MRRYGIVPAPAPTTDFPIQIDRIPRQQETDLDFLTRIARRNGFVFYVEPVTLGVSTAYLGPGEPARAAAAGDHDRTWARRRTRTASSFSYDGLAPVGVEGSFVEPFTKISIPLPALPPLKVPPLALKPAPAYRTVLTRDTAQRNPAAGSARRRWRRPPMRPDASPADGTLDTARYGHALRARRLVGVRGAGLSYDGLYYVHGVTHTIERGKLHASVPDQPRGHRSRRRRW